MKKEIERKFLLKDLPISPEVKILEIQNIIQHYYKVGDIWYRIRKIDSNIYGNTFLHTIKTYKDGITYEEEEYYTHEEYVKLINDINSGKYEAKFISKTRFIYTTGVDADFEGEIKNIKWEIDKFNFNLMIAEIEIPSYDYNIEIPNYIQEQIIYEITNINELSNRNLANFIKVY